MERMIMLKYLNLDIYRYRFENNFVWLIEIIRTLKLIARMLKFFSVAINT